MKLSESCLVQVPSLNQKSELFSYIHFKKTKPEVKVINHTAL